MKNLKSLFFSALFMVISFSNLMAENNDLFSKDYKIKSFTSVNANTIADIIYTQSAEVVVKAVGSQGMVDNLSIDVNKGVLTIQNDKELISTNGQPIVIFISSPTITSIETHGKGNWCLKGKVNADNLDIKCEGIGCLQALELHTKRVSVMYDGLGDLKLGGTTNLVEITSGGVGIVDCKNLNAKTAMVRSTKTGEVNCFATESVGLFNEGIGEITYSGNPTYKNLQNSGMGNIEEVLSK